MGRAPVSRSGAATSRINWAVAGLRWRASTRQRLNEVTGVLVSQIIFNIARSRVVIDRFSRLFRHSLKIIMNILYEIHDLAIARSRAVPVSGGI